MRCVLAALLLCGIESRAQPFTNGGFEIISGPPIASNTSQTLNVGDTWLPGWSAGGPDGAVAVQNGSVGPAFFDLGPWQGQQWALFPNDSLGGSLSQTFATAVGAYCTIGFVGAYVYAANDPLLGVTITAADGFVLSNTTENLSFRTWTAFQLTFIATTTNTTLTFTDASSQAQGADIGVDGVTLVAEPPGWPFIITSPASQTNAAGTQATFTASAGGYPSTVQWYLGTNAVAGATNTTLTVIADVTNAGSYTAVFSNSAGTNISAAAVLTVLQIVASPVNQTATAGTAVLFNASVNLSQAAVQWYLGTYPISGATSPALVLIAGDQTAGSYTAQFTEGGGTVTSGAALLTVLNIPFTNGSFELTSGTTIPPDDDQAGNVGDTWLRGWSFGGTVNEVFVFNGPLLGLNAADGEQWVVFDSQNVPPPGVVFQTFSTTVGDAYVVTFAAVAVYYYDTAFKSLAATATASTGSLLGSTVVDPPTDWSTNQFTFTAQTVNTVLAFTDASDPNIGPSVALDDVTVVDLSSSLTAAASQPAPGSFVMRLAGQSGQSYVIQTSTNLAVWFPASTNILNAPSVNITNTLLPGANQQFWRVILAP
jgi:hypothetical protein